VDSELTYSIEHSLWEANQFYS